MKNRSFIILFLSFSVFVFFGKGNLVQANQITTGQHSEKEPEKTERGVVQVGNGASDPDTCGVFDKNCGQNSERFYIYSCTKNEVVITECDTAKTFKNIVSKVKENPSRKNTIDRVSDCVPVSAESTRSIPRTEFMDRIYHSIRTDLMPAPESVAGADLSAVKQVSENDSVKLSECIQKLNTDIAAMERVLDSATFLSAEQKLAQKAEIDRLRNQAIQTNKELETCKTNSGAIARFKAAIERAVNEICDKPIQEASGYTAAIIKGTYNRSGPCGLTGTLKEREADCRQRGSKSSPYITVARGADKTGASNKEFLKLNKGTYIWGPVHKDSFPHAEASKFCASLNKLNSDGSTNSLYNESNRQDYLGPLNNDDSLTWGLPDSQNFSAEEFLGLPGTYRHWFWLKGDFFENRYSRPGISNTSAWHDVGPFRCVGSRRTKKNP